MDWDQSKEQRLWTGIKVKNRDHGQGSKERTKAMDWNQSKE